MSLIFANEALEAADQFILIAKDSATGSSVIVGLALETVEDFGLESAKRVAEAKYNAGLLEENGSVFVRASELKANRT